MMMNKYQVRGVIVERFGSQCVAAKQLGLTERRLSRLLNGHDELKPEEAKVFQKKLGMTLKKNELPRSKLRGIRKD